MSHYDVLGVAPDAPAAEVRAAFVALARRHHPDFHTGDGAAGRADAERRMRAINEAWSVLSDARRRAAYDRAQGLVPDPTAFRPIEPDEPGDPDPRTEPDVPYRRPPAREQRQTRLATLLPVGLFGAAVSLVAFGLVLAVPAIIALGAVLFLLSCASFVVVPLLLLAHRDPGRGLSGVDGAGGGRGRTAGGDLGSTVVATYLDAIVAAHRTRAATDPRPLEALLERAADQPAARPFTAALVAEDDLAVIAEVKRRSPSKGPLALDLDPASLARSYQCGGATCLSVLTDEPHFGGSAADLAAARAACSLPVLRKDFTVDLRDVVDARLMGADAVLLIVAALDDHALLGDCLDLAARLGFAALVEVHDEVELARATSFGATLIGVNRRDLSTFEVDRTLAARLRERMGPGVVSVAESGVRGAEDAVALAAAGYDAVLVGETLVTSDDPEAAVVDLRGGGGTPS